MKRFHKGEKIRDHRLNQMVEMLETLQAKVTALEGKLALSGGAGNGLMAGGVMGAVSAAGAAYKRRTARPRLHACLWTPFWLDLSTGLTPPGSPGWYVRKAPGEPPEKIEAEFSAGMRVWLKRPEKEGAGCVPEELVFVPKDGERPKDKATCCAVVGYYHTYLGSFSEDCKLKKLAESVGTANTLAFFPARRGRGVVSAIAPQYDMWGNALQLEDAVPLVVEGGATCGLTDDTPRIARLVATGGMRITTKCGAAWLASGIDIAPYDSPELQCGSVNVGGVNLPRVVDQWCCLPAFFPPQYECKGWRKVAQLDVGAQQVGLFAVPILPGQWALRFAPGTLAIGGGVQGWRRYAPDASKGEKVPAPGDEVCGAMWAQLSSACLVARYAPATCSGGYDFTGLYSTRTLIAPGKNEETGCSWMWFIEEERCKLLQCGAYWGAEGCWRIKSYSYSQP